MTRPKKYDNPDGLSYYKLKKVHNGNPPIAQQQRKSKTEVVYRVKRIDKDVIVRFD